MICQMNEEPKRLWVEALRSEEFPQTKGALRDADGYCCLGVLCEVAIKAGVVVAVTPPDTHDDYGRWTYDDKEELPPKAVLEWAFGTPDPELNVLIESDEGDGNLREAELIELNDTYGWTFEQIADAVEEHL